MLTAEAPAKLNLGLWILRRRRDGYHDILTVFQAIDLFDTLSATRKSRSLTLECDDPRLPAGESNLVLKAARALQKHTGCRLGAHFRLTKRIPSGAGMGGGSSDAAAALRLLNRLWELNVAESALRRLAVEVGSDVPFFLVGGTAVGRGRGDRLTSIRIRGPMHFVLIHGSSKISAKSAYSSYKRELTASGPPPRIAALEKGDVLGRETVKSLTNQLERGLSKRFPDIAERKDLLWSQGAIAAHLTGSGSTVFGIFDSKQKAFLVASQITKEGYPVGLCQSISSGVTVRG